MQVYNFIFFIEQLELQGLYMAAATVHAYWYLDNFLTQNDWFTKYKIDPKMVGLSSVKFGMNQDALHLTIKC